MAADFLGIVGIACVIGVGVVWQVVSHFRRIFRMRRWNYEWYRREFPELARYGRVACYECGGSDVGTERVMEHTYMRGHICRTCGTTLYYSSES
jgi:hypothetical protein